MSNDQNSRRDFFKKASMTGMAAMTLPLVSMAGESEIVLPASGIESKLIIPKAQGLKYNF
jgi:hypothetical protein